VAEGYNNLWAASSCERPIAAPGGQLDIYCWAKWSENYRIPQA